MPILNYNSDSLYFKGPILEVTITLPKNLGDIIQETGKQVPFLRVNALLDTGASDSLIDNSIVDYLGLKSIDSQTYLTASIPHTLPQYDIGIILSQNKPSPIPILAGCMPMPFQGINAIIGRDVLKKCTFFYNGPNDSFTLSF